MDNVPPYTVFPVIYDRTIRSRAFSKWAKFIREVLLHAKITDGVFAELASGTGNLTKHLTFLPKLIALDLSFAMLKKSKQKMKRPLLQADMQKLPFQDTSLAGIFCVHDSINYLEGKSAVFDHLQEVYRVLKPGGIYVFDSVSEYNILHYYDNQCFEEKHGKYDIIWRNKYNAVQKVIISEIVIYGKKQIPVCETHKQYIYACEEIAELIEQVGFNISLLCGDYQFQKDPNTAQLMTFVIRKPK